MQQLGLACEKLAMGNAVELVLGRNFPHQTNASIVHVQRKTINLVTMLLMMMMAVTNVITMMHKTMMTVMIVIMQTMR